jgi:hypothetical protein
LASKGDPAIPAIPGLAFSVCKTAGGGLHCQKREMKLPTRLLQEEPWIMRRTFLLAGLLLALALVLPTRADDKKPDPKPGDKLVNKTDLSGKLKHVEGPGKGIRVEIQVPKLDMGVAQNITTWQRELATTRDPRRAAELRKAIAENQPKLYKPQPVDVDIEPGEDVKVAAANPPVAFDDKGKIKKYTAKELAELKEDPKSKFFKADFDSLKPGQLVTVSVGWKKDAVKPKPGKEKDPDWLAENKPIAIKIIIVAEPMEK